MFVLAVFLIVIIRIIPYIKNGFYLPLGYDAGLYKYSIEYGLLNLDEWIINGMEPGFLYFMTFLHIFIPTDILLIYVFILFNVILGISIYIFSKEYFNKDVALLSLIIYSISAIQFKVFTYLYYKNIIALSLLLFSFYFLKKENYVFFIISGVLIGIFHRPTFYIFGLSYFFYAMTSPYKPKDYDFDLLRKNVFYGLLILALTLVFYSRTFKPAIINLIFPVVSSFVQTGTSPGTFITFFDYQFSILFYLPLAVLGLFYLIKNSRFDIFFFYTILTAAIVYFQFFFFNRFIIFLDISFIILSALGIYVIVHENKKLGLMILTFLLLAGLIFLYHNSANYHPLLNKETFDSIRSINVSSDSYIISISSKFSPYLQGYAGSNYGKSYNIIAPGLFDYDIWSLKEKWSVFWSDLDASELETRYNKDIYLFTTNKVDNECYVEQSKNLYIYNC